MDIVFRKDASMDSPTRCKRVARGVVSSAVRALATYSISSTRGASKRALLPAMFKCKDGDIQRATQIFSLFHSWTRE
jgi:hypothetical protein